MPENEAPDKHAVLFMGLVTSFQQNALIAMGKMVNPATGKAERQLEDASAFIDMLDMLTVKTRGNVKPEETSTLEQIVSHLKMNYLEELNKPEDKDAESDKTEDAADKTESDDSPSS